MAARRREPCTAQVVIEVERRVRCPAGRTDGAYQGLDNALTEPRHEVSAPFVRGAQTLPVRRGVQELQRDNGGRQLRVALGSPHHGFEVVHAPGARPPGDRFPALRVLVAAVGTCHSAGQWSRVSCTRARNDAACRPTSPAFQRRVLTGSRTCTSTMPERIAVALGGISCAVLRRTTGTRGTPARRARWNAPCLNSPSGGTARRVPSGAINTDSPPPSRATSRLISRLASCGLARSR